MRAYVPVFFTNAALNVYGAVDWTSMSMIRALFVVATLFSVASLTP